MKFFNEKGGGNVKVINEKPVWKKVAKIEHVARDYKPKGGQVKILNEKGKFGSFFSKKFSFVLCFYYFNKKNFKI